jgi:hypothetical protein
MEMARFGAFSLDSATRQLMRDGREVSLSPKAFQLLLLLVVNRYCDRVVSINSLGACRRGKCCAAMHRREPPRFNEYRIIGTPTREAKGRVKKAPTAEAGAKTPISDVRPLAQGLNETTHMTDARAFIGWLDRQSSVARNRKLGTQGYCMGGPIAFRTAAAMPDASARLPRSMAVGWRPTCRTARIFKPRRRRRSSSSKLPRTTTSDRPTRRMF